MFYRLFFSHYRLHSGFGSLLLLNGYIHAPSCHSAVESTACCGLNVCWCCSGFSRLLRPTDKTNMKKKWRKKWRETCTRKLAITRQLLLDDVYMLHCFSPPPVWIVCLALLTHFIVWYEIVFYIIQTNNSLLDGGLKFKKKKKRNSIFLENENLQSLIHSEVSKVSNAMCIGAIWVCTPRYVAACKGSVLPLNVTICSSLN